MNSERTVNVIVNGKQPSSDSFLKFFAAGILVLGAYAYTGRAEEGSELRDLHDKAAYLLEDTLDRVAPVDDGDDYACVDLEPNPENNTDAVVQLPLLCGQMIPNDTGGPIHEDGSVNLRLHIDRLISESELSTIRQSNPSLPAEYYATLSSLNTVEGMISHLNSSDLCFDLIASIINKINSKRSNDDPLKIEAGSSISATLFTQAENGGNAYLQMGCR